MLSGTQLDGVALVVGVGSVTYGGPLLIRMISQEGVLASKLPSLLLRPVSKPLCLPM